MQTLWTDLRYGLRSLLRQPGFTLAATLALALGIGASTAIFSVVNGVLLRPLPYPEPQRLVEVWNQLLASGLPRLWLSEPELLYYRENIQSFEGIGVYTTRGANLTGEGRPLRVNVSHVSAELFPLLGIQPALGRDFSSAEDLPGHDDVVILSHAFFAERFGADADDVLGRNLTLDARSYTVVGVMPRGFAFPSTGQELWKPIAINPEDARAAGNHYLRAVGRIKSGVDLGEAQADIQRVARQYAHFNKDYFGGQPEKAIQERGWGAYLLPLHDGVVGDVRPALLVLLGAVACLLLVACANVANLMLARGATREGELAVRAALGASRGRMVRQLLTEALLLAVAGGVAGVLLAVAGVRGILALGLDELPRQHAIAVDWHVLAFACALSLATGLLSGLVPALGFSRLELIRNLKEGSRSASGGRRQRLRQALVVAEVALALVLLAGGGLLLRSFERMLRVDPGFRSDHLLTLRIALPEDRYAQPQDQHRFFASLMDRLAALPGVDAVGSTFILPFSGLGASGTVSVESAGAGYVATGRPRRYPHVETDYRTASPGYFRAMGMTLREGRFLEDSDDEQAPLVAVVDESFARHFWPNENAVGRRVTIGGGSDPQWRRIVGVVGHVKNNALNVEGREQAYVPSAQYPVSARYLALRTSVAPASLAGVVRQEVAALDPELPVFDVKTMQQRLGGSLATARAQALLLSLFALAALALAAVGVYGVTSYSVAQRRREFGIRVALGAQSSSVMRLVLRHGLGLALLGTAVGLAGAASLSRVLAHLLFELSPTDPATFAGAVLGLLATAVLACYLPARRATRVDPAVALRYE